MNYYNLDIEKAILSTILFDNTTIDKIEAILKYDDFYHPFHQKIYKVMLSLKEKELPIDEVFIQEQLKNEFDESLFIEIMTTTPVSMLDVYSKDLKKLATKRKLELFLNKKKAELIDKDDIEILNELEQEIKNFQNNSIDKFTLNDFNNVENKEIEFLLKDSLPIPKKAVTLLSARGGAGKSWLALQIALKVINQTNKKIFAWLSEDPLFATKKRAELIIDKILNTNQKLSFFAKYFKYLGSETRPFHIVEYNYKQKQINSMFYKLKNTLKDFELIIIDPLIAFYGGDENNNSQAREFMNLLTEWADKEDKAILVIHHNNKSVEGGIRGASAFVDAVRLHYELLSPDKENPLPNGYRTIKIQKDNWGVERIIGKKEIDIQVFPSIHNNTGRVVDIDNSVPVIEEKDFVSDDEKISWLNL